MAKLSYPLNLSVKQVCQFTKELASSPASKKLEIDTGPRRNFSPTSLIMLSKAGMQRWRDHPNEVVTYRGLNNHGYANNLGFSEALSIKDKPFPQRAFGGNTYIPISRMIRADLEIQALEADIHIGDQIEASCVPIANTVSQGISPELTITVAEMFREIFRNIFEHSGAEAAGYCAQYWKTSGKVEICVADKGIGVRESLMENKYLTDKYSDAEALKLAVLPGLSSKAWRHKKKKSSQKSEWDNAGYGLFLTHKLFGSLGHFMIASGNSAIYFQPNNPPQMYECHVVGTVVSMSINLTKESRIQEVLKSVRNEAADVKANIGTKSVNLSKIDDYLGF